MAGRAVELFEAIRPEVVARVIDGRGSLQLGLSDQSAELARAQLDAVLDRMGGFLAEPDPERYRGFISRWVAYHLGEGFSPENLVHSVVTVGDLLVQVARRRSPGGAETAAIVRELSVMTLAIVRLVVNVLGDELATLASGGRAVVPR